MQANLLKSARVKYDYNQKKMSEALGLSISNYNKKEKNKRPFSLKEVKKLKELLNLTDKEVIEIFLD